MRSSGKSLSTVPGILGPIFIKSGLPGYISSSASVWWHTPYLADVHKISPPGMSKWGQGLGWPEPAQVVV